MSFRWWVIITAAILGTGFGVGLTFTLTMPFQVAGLFSEELAALQQLGQILKPYSIQTAMFIFIQNSSTLLLSFLLSPLLCLLPVLSLLFNGILIGFVSVFAAQQESIGFVLAGLIPHGILEIPAIVIGEAAALSFGATALLAVFSTKRRNALIPNLRRNLRYLAIALIILVPAALLETYVTRWVLGLFGYP